MFGATSISDYHRIFAFRRNVHLIAVFATESFSTSASVSSSGVLTSCSILAGFQRCTFIHVLFTVSSLVPGWTCALIVVADWFARSTVLTRILSLAPAVALVSTVTEPTVRGPRQPIDEECPTVPDTDFYVPETNVVVPVEANHSLDSSIIFSRMLTIHPARCMGSTMMYRHWGGRHSGSSSICEAVPPNGKIVAVTFEGVSSVRT